MKEIITQISHGMYVLTTIGGGCIVDAVCQISSGEKPLISISVNKTNYTNELLHSQNHLVLAILSKNVDGNVIDNFGFHSARDYDKFEKIETFEVNQIQVPKDIIGYLELEIEDRIENETHTLFIARYVDGKTFKDDIEMTYNYYREHKDEFVKVKTIKGETAWICTICGYVYYGEELPEGFLCPKCGVDASLFQKME
ncbi:MAG: flavin reductase [Clostridia bacterium]|nr:flavin reductase [Clostridia bacterium]